MPSWALTLEHYLPLDWVPAFRRCATSFERVGWQTTVVQTLAIMEVVHSVLGWVRSPLTTVAMQVASRYYIVWGITYLFPSVRVHLIYFCVVRAHLPVNSLMTIDPHKPSVHKHDPLLVHHRSHSLRLLCPQPHRLRAVRPSLDALHNVLPPLPNRRLV